MNALIVDDHPLFRAALVHLIEKAHPGSVIAQAGTAEAGLKILAGKFADDGFDVVLLDLNLPGMSGAIAVQAFINAARKTPVIVVSASERAQEAKLVLALGAKAYLLKSLPPDTFLHALSLALEGGVYHLNWLGSDVAVPRADAAATPAIKPRSGSIDPVTDLRGRLSDRQFTVLLLVCQGHTNREIGEQLNITEATVKTHLSIVFRILGVVTRSQAIFAARQFGLEVVARE